jgi:hypothetical protein
MKVMRFLTFPIILCQLVGCDLNHIRPSNDNVWEPLGLFSDAFNSTFIEGDTLFAAAGVAGVHQRTPARTGKWSEIGFTYPEWLFEGAENGPSFVTLAGNDILVGFSFAVGDFTPLVRADRDSLTQWRPSASGMQRGSIYEVLQTGPSDFIAATSHSFYRSSDNALTWTSVGFRITENATFSQPGTRIYAAGRNGKPVLAYSDDQGTLFWRQIDLAEKMIPNPTAISSVTLVNETELLVSTDTGTFWSPDSGASFVNVLPTAISGKLLANPLIDGEVIVVADSVHHSTSVPGPWTSWPLPGRRMPVAAASADWEHRFVIIPILDHDTGQLYLCNIPGNSQ